MAPIYCNRFASLGVATFVLMVFMFATLHHGEGPIRKIKEAAASAADSAASSAQQQLCSNDSPIFSRPSFQDSISRLYDNVKHPVTATDYVDAFNASFNITNDFSWHEPLAGEVLIVDMDTRAPDGKNEIFGKDKINWETMSGEEGGGMLSASFLNHFMYAQIHGYDYKFYRAESMEDHHNTWIKPHVLAELLHSYRFVVFIDADATIQHLEVPLEWLFNRWGITNNTSIAMPIDTKQILNGDENASCDSKGNVTLNTGFIIAQALPFTFEMMTAWKTCTNGKRYPKCGVWKQEWSHEQRAFSEYIRYDFNPDGDNIVSIPCDDAMGYPGLAENHKHIISDCKGQFVRHHTIDKSMTKTDTSNAMLQSLTEIMQKTLKKNKHEYWVSEGERTKSFMESFRGKDD